MLSGLLCVCFVFAIAFTPPAKAAASPKNSQSHPALSLSTLQQRIAHPIRQGGATVIDLKGFNIDLSGSDFSGSNFSDRDFSDRDLRKSSAAAAEFADQFYQLLQRALSGKTSKSSPYLGIDFSGALIKGNFQLSRIAQRVPAYGDAFMPALEDFKHSFQLSATQQSTTPYPRIYSRRLSRFLLPTGTIRQSDTLAFQGPLLLNKTCFNGPFNASNIYFLNRVEAQETIFTQQTQWQATKFAQSALFSRSQFQQDSSFRGALFADKVRLNQTRFNGLSNWQGATFHGTTSFTQADFQSVNFARAHWHTDADFERVRFRETANFQKNRFDGALFLTEADLEGAVSFRQAQFQKSISLRAAHVMTQLDFGDARFSSFSSFSNRRFAGKAPKAVSINVADLDFSAGEAKILGSAGYIGKMFSVPTLTSNETVLRSLVRNFRLLEQISDANQLEYTIEQLRLSQIRRHLLGTSLNQAGIQKLVSVGFSPVQAAAVIEQVAEQPFASRTDLLSMDEIDLATYLKVRDRITTQPTSLVNRGKNLLQWLVLASLLQLSGYGTDVGLTFSIGITIVTLFALMFWGVDRYRRLTPTPIVPTRAESIAMALSSIGLLVISLSFFIQSASQPLAALTIVGLLTIPIPSVLIVRLYQQGRYHDLMDRSYFVENGALRQLQVLIARLPILPKFPFYRDRYTPLLSDRKWNWLNYFDFSLNNWFKFGFNDIRLRDRCVPGLISALVWYQWSLGVIYITLLLWTLSRTIPGLNLLLYF